MCTGRECVSDHGKAACAELGGICETTRDGFYITSTLCIIVGAVVLLFFVAPAGRRLQCKLELFDWARVCCIAVC